MTEEVTQHLEHRLGIDLGAYRLVSSVSRYVNRLADVPQVSYLSRDGELRELLHERPELFDIKPFCPDMVVYNGPAIHRTDDLTDVEGLQAYLSFYGDLPRVIVYKGEIFLVAANLRKARERWRAYSSFISLSSNIHRSLSIRSAIPRSPTLGTGRAERYRRKI